MNRGSSKSALNELSAIGDGNCWHGTFCGVKVVCDVRGQCQPFCVREISRVFFKFNSRYYDDFVLKNVLLNKTHLSLLTWGDVVE